MRFSCGRVGFFLIFRVCKIRARFGGVLGGSGGGFSRHFGSDLVDFEGSKRSQISSSKLEGEKVVPKTYKGFDWKVRRPYYRSLTSPSSTSLIVDR